MRDNPTNVRTFAVPDWKDRSSVLTRFFRPVLQGLYWRGVILGAFQDDIMVGVGGIAGPRMWTLPRVRGAVIYRRIWRYFRSRGHYVFRPTPFVWSVIVGEPDGIKILCDVRRMR